MISEKSKENIKILLVCSGNLYRSPVAAAIMRKSLEKYETGRIIEVITAGLDAESGKKVPVDILRQLKENYGINLSGHITRPLTTEIFQSAQLVIAMEQGQLMRLAQQYPRQTRKLRLLSELTDQLYDIQDPAKVPGYKIGQLVSQLQLLINNGLTTLFALLKIDEVEMRV